VEGIFFFKSLYKIFLRSTMQDFSPSRCDEAVYVICKMVNGARRAPLSPQSCGRFTVVRPTACDI
jgi:hypothetical protein